MREHPFHLPHVILECTDAVSGLPDVRCMPAFQKHPVVVEHGAGNTEAIGLFVDGTDWSTSESFICYYATVGSEQRHVLSTVDKLSLCDCGCSGSCTLLAVDRILAWSLQAAAARRHPERRHDGSAFPADSMWATRAGTQLRKARLFCRRATTCYRLGILWPTKVERNTPLPFVRLYKANVLQLC